MYLFPCSPKINRSFFPLFPKIVFVSIFPSCLDLCSLVPLNCQLHAPVNDEGTVQAYVCFIVVFSALQRSLESFCSVNNMSYS